MTEARQKGVRKVNETRIKVRETNGDHQGYIEWIKKFDFRNLPVEDRRTTKNERRTTKNGWKSSRNHPRKRYGSASAWIFFTDTIFLTNFKWLRSTRRVEPFSSSPSIYRKIGEELATQLAQASQIASSRSNRLLEEQSGRPKWAWLLFAPQFLLSTPSCLFFGWFFFRNVTKLYEFRNDTCLLSVRLRNLTGHVITPFLAFGMLQKLTNCVTILPFDFWHVTEFHGLRNNASFWFLACLGTSRIVQQRVPSTSKQSTKGCMPSNNSPRTKLGYDSRPSLLTFYRR